MAVHSQSLLQSFPHLGQFLFESIREGFQYFILFRTSRRIYWLSHPMVSDFVLMSNLLHQLPHSHSSFYSSFTVILLSSIFSCQCHLLVQWLGSAERREKPLHGWRRSLSSPPAVQIALSLFTSDLKIIG